MLRIIHTADVHLGARHDDLGEQAAAQRERQFAAFKATIDLALAEKVDLFLIAGDLFDSNVQPRRSVERVAAELKRLAEARIRTVIIPGTHDCYDRASIYRAYDLAALAGRAPDDDLVTVLDPDHPSVHLAALDLGRPRPGLRHEAGAAQPARRASADRRRSDATRPAATWRIGMVHGSIAIPGKTEHDEVVITTDEIAASGLDYLALGHWHSTQTAKAGGVTYAYPGPRAGRARPGPRRQGPPRRARRARRHADGHGPRAPGRPDPLREGRDRCRDRRPASRPSSTLLAARADPDLVLDVRLVGVRRDELDLHLDEIETALAPLVPQGPRPRCVASRP